MLPHRFCTPTGRLPEESLIYVCAPIHTVYMTTKNISITDEAYEALRREKRKEESFTETILRLTESRGKLSDSFGSWKLSDEEEAMIKRELSKGWKLAQERVLDEVSRH